MPPRKNKNRRNREAADPMVNCVLPPKIIISILSRLPVKTLVRFRRVCKPWQSLFTDRTFINLHYSRFSETPKTWCENFQLINFMNVGLNPTKELDPSRPEDVFLGSCKGLLCLGRPLVTDRILLWNPATRLWKVLPHPIGDYGRTAEIVSLGFGCNKEGDDYKVVRIFCKKGKKMKVNVEVYSSRSDCWKAVNAGFPFRVLFLVHQAVVNGNPHWVAYNDAYQMVLLRFDSTRMSFAMISLPDLMGGKLAFMDWEGSLGAVHSVISEGDWVEWMDIWVYDVGGEKWGRKARVEMEGTRFQVENCLDYNPRKGKIVGRCRNGSLFEVDVNNKGVRVFGEERGGSGLFQMFAHEESLAYVRGMTAMDLTMSVYDGKKVDCVLDGFFTCLMPPRGGSILVFYPLAF